MNFEGKNILLISPEGWGMNYVSKHHYAEVLVELGNQVYFLNPPAGKFATQKTENGVHLLDYQPMMRGLARLPKILSSKLTLVDYRRLEKYAKVKFDIIWNFDSSRFFNLAGIPNQVFKICHLVDLNQNIQRSLLAYTSDICFGTTKYIVEELRKHNSNSHLLSHAYRPPSMEKTTNFQIPGEQTLKALYVGNLAMQYIDWRTLLEAASTHQQIDFVFVGPDGNSNLSNQLSSNADKQALKDLPNVYFCPSVHSWEIPQILQLADYLLIAYQEEHHKDQAAPHKMLEYLASGKTVVATYTEEFDDDKWLPQLRMCKRNKNFVDLLHFQEVIEKQKGIIPTYVNRISQLSKLIQS